ncbi:MAG: type II toxin-antitoxin system RelE/ParE family toxin [Planctomycetes bacterium]|nr:type II toxin-antitoxin system RelE/ParE family toxin [Planctomycetota bacterium]
MSRIVWTDPALEALEGIRAYIARDSEFYASALVLDIIAAVERLARFPRLGRFVPELHDGHTREILAGNYRVAYDVVGDAVCILTVLHGARQFPVS